MGKLRLRPVLYRAAEYDVVHDRITAIGSFYAKYVRQAGPEEPWPERGHRANSEKSYGWAAKCSMAET